MGLNQKYYLNYFKYGIGAITLIVALLIVKSTITSEKEAEHKLNIETNEKLVTSYELLKIEVHSLKKFVEDQKVDHNNYYNIVSPDSVDLNMFNKKDKYSYWFIYCYDKINYRVSYGVKLKGTSFNEKKISKVVDPDRNKGNTNSIDRGGISFFKRISLEEYNNCENQVEVK